MNKIKGKLEINPNGSGFLISEQEEKIYVYKKNTGIGLDQDVVEIELIPGKTEGTTEGKVVNLIQRNKTQFTGVLQKTKDFGFLKLDARRISVDFYLRPDQSKKYKTGEKLLVEIGNWRIGSNPTCKVIRSLGMVGENDAEMDSILIQYGLNPIFPKEVELESEGIEWNISEEEISKRRDFRDITTFTIDGSDAKDLDDAISIEYDNDDNIRLGVHIADVSHFIRRGSNLDEEAKSRGNSVYFPDRVIPMIPERISNGVCSLNPNLDKLTFSFIFILDKNGKIINKEFTKGIINSNYRLTYDEVQKVIEGGETTHTEELKKHLITLDKYAKIIRGKRMNDSLSFNRSEVKFELDHDMKPVGIISYESKDAHKLIEEFMVLTNQEVCKFISDKGYSLNRVHDRPDIQRMEELSNFVSTLGYEFNINDVNIKSQINKLLLDVKDTPHEDMVSALVVRTQTKAVYQTNNIGHWGMGLEYYVHTTSPIRRYIDLCVHRILTDIIYTDNEKYNKKDLDIICEQCNVMEQNAKRAERDSIKFKQIEYLLDKVGQVFNGTITGVTSWGVYIELTDSRCEGLVRNDDIDGRIEKEKYRIVMSDGTLKLGDSIMVKVKRVSLLNKEIDMIIF